jgi:DNA-directed RNA polymerase specialized sigma24 family protein
MPKNRFRKSTNWSEVKNRVDLLTPLAKRAAKGDQAALFELKIHSYSILSQFSRSICSQDVNPEDAAGDLTHDFILALDVKIRKYSGHSKFSTWAYRVLTNRCSGPLNLDRKKWI